MSVQDKDSVDGIAYDAEKKALVLLISDHIDWSDEYTHLCTLQEKINKYIHFCESKQYLSIFDKETITSAIIDIHFLFEPSNKAFEFLQVVQDQIGQMGIIVQCTISGDGV